MVYKCLYRRSIRFFATSAIEAVLSSIDIPDIFVYSNGEFGDRLKTIAKKHLKINPGSPYQAYCQFETSKSIYNNADAPDYVRKGYIVDCVSGFPYYPLPKKADIIITSSSKILGGMPVLGIVFIKREWREKLKKDPVSYYLDLKRIWDYDNTEETPHTSLMPQYMFFHLLMI